METPAADPKGEYGRYLEGLVERLWRYRGTQFAGAGAAFDWRILPNPPVFSRPQADLNVLVRPGASEAERQQVLAELPIGRRHKWFGSMKSSQALAQSVFANLKVLGKLDILAGIIGDDGQPIFFSRPASEYRLALDHPIGHLREPRPTSVDVLLSGPEMVAVECKLSEGEIGTCSRPRLRPGEANYDRDYCDGTYRLQQGRAMRCSLSAVGVAYWRYLPSLFKWESDVDYLPCPLRETYQLVRNVLAACVRPDGSIAADGGHAVLLYDAHNPQFRPGGKGYAAYATVRQGLRQPSLLQLCTWQQVATAIRQDPQLGWLGEALASKYGL